MSGRWDGGDVVKGNGFVLLVSGMVMWLCGNDLCKLSLALC